MDWSIWRVVDAGYGTYTEVCETWTLLDLWEAHAVLDALMKARQPRKG